MLTSSLIFPNRSVVTPASPSKSITQDTTNILVGSDEVE
jgi:hypothetical protein